MDLAYGEVVKLFEGISCDDLRSSKSICYKLSSDVFSQDIKNFDDFLKKRGGHTGGWDIEAHTLFISLIKKHDIELTAHLLHHQLPDITEDQVYAHEKWYAKYLELKGIQRSALKKWRSFVNLKEEITRTSSSASTSSTRTSTTFGDDTVKQKIREWKAEKELEKERAKEKKELEDKKTKEINMSKRFLQEQKKCLLSNYKRDRMNQERSVREMQRLFEENRKKQSSKIANQTLLQFRKQDKLYVEKINEIKKTRQRQLEENEEAWCKVLNKLSSSVKVEKNASRVLEPTKEWNRKLCVARYEVQKAKDALSNKPIMSLESIQRRAIPNWRKT